MSRKFLALGIMLSGFIIVACISFVLMERHWNDVSRRVSEGTARNMAAIVDLFEASSGPEDIARLIDMGRDRFNLSVTVLPAGPLPAPRPKPYFDLLDRALSEELRASVRRPFWIDTVAEARHLEVRIQLDQATLRFVAPRRQAHASNSHVFLLWMIGAWSIVLAVGYLLL